MEKTNTPNPCGDKRINWSYRSKPWVIAMFCFFNPPPFLRTFDLLVTNHHLVLTFSEKMGHPKSSTSYWVTMCEKWMPQFQENRKAYETLTKTHIIGLFHLGALSYFTHLSSSAIKGDDS